MVEDKSKSLDVLLPSTFVPQFESSRLPLTSKLLRPIVYVTGDLFKLVSSRTEQVVNKEGAQVPRAVYIVQVLNRKQLDIGTTLIVKVKGAENVFSEKDNVALLEGKNSLVVVFDNIRLWQLGSSEGLTADNIRILDITPTQAISIHAQGKNFNNKEEG